jgi:hypothetical protein
LGDVTSFNIAFTDYPTSTSRVMHADNQYQIAVTVTLNCTDQDGSPLSGPTNDDLLDSTTLIYFDNGDELTWTSSLSPETAGNPLAFTNVPSSGYAPPTKARTPRDQPGVYSIIFYVSAPSQSDTSVSKIGAKFSTSEKTYTTQADSFNKFITLSAYAGNWWNLGVVENLNFNFSPNSSASSQNLYANGSNQCTIIVTITCQDQDGYALAGITNQDMLDTAFLISDATLEDLTRTDNPGDNTGDQLIYSTTSLGYLGEPPGATRFFQEETAGQYSVTYYLSAGENITRGTYTIAAKFAPPQNEYTTHTGSFTKTLDIVVQSAKSYTAADFTIDYGYDSSGKVQFYGDGNSHPPRDVDYDTVNYFLYLSDKDNFNLQDATFTTKLTNGTSESLFAVYDHQTSTLRNAVYADNFSYNQGKKTISRYFCVVGQGGNKDTTSVNKVSSEPVSLEVNQYPYAATLCRMSASTDETDYNAGDNSRAAVQVAFHDQYGNSGVVNVTASDEELDGLNVSNP